MAPTTEHAMEPIGASVRTAGKGVAEQVNKMAGSISQIEDSVAQTIQDTLRRTQNSAVLRWEWLQTASIRQLHISAIVGWWVS